MGNNVVAYLRDVKGVTKEDFNSLLDLSDSAMESKITLLLGADSGGYLDRTLHFVRVLRQIG